MGFVVGDCVVHPAYGGGTITGITEKSFLNHSNEYYEIHMPLKNMTIMVPVTKVEELGVRPVSSKSEIKTMWQLLQDEPGELSDKYQERQEGIRDQIRTGDLFEISKALRDLMGRQDTHKLTQADRGLVEQAESFVACEVALATELTIDEVRVKIKETICVSEE